MKLYCLVSCYCLQMELVAFYIWNMLCNKTAFQNTLNSTTTSFKMITQLNHHLSHTCLNKNWTLILQSKKHFCFFCRWSSQPFLHVCYIGKAKVINMEDWFEIHLGSFRKETGLFLINGFNFNWFPEAELTWSVVRRINKRLTLPSKASISYPVSP